MKSILRQTERRTAMTFVATKQKLPMYSLIMQTDPHVNLTMLYKHLPGPYPTGTAVKDKKQ